MSKEIQTGSEERVDRKIKDVELYLRRICDNPGLVKKHYMNYSPLLFPGFEVDIDYDPDNKESDSSPLIGVRHAQIKLKGDNCGLLSDNSFADDFMVNLLGEAKSGALEYLDLTLKQMEKYNIPGATLTAAKTAENTVFLYYRPNKHLKEGLFIYNLADAMSMVAADKTLGVNKFTSLEDVLTFWARKKNKKTEISPRLQLLHRINNKRENSYDFDVRVLTGLVAPAEIIDPEHRENSITIGLFYDRRGHKRGEDIDNILGGKRKKEGKSKDKPKSKPKEDKKPVPKDKPKPKKDKKPSSEDEEEKKKKEPSIEWDDLHIYDYVSGKK